MEIVYYVESDAKSLARLVRSPELQNIDGSYLSEDDFKKIIHDKALIFVAKENNSLIGFISGSIIKGGFAYITLLVVDPAFRGRGVGKKLLSFFEDRCRSFLSIF